MPASIDADELEQEFHRSAGRARAMVEHYQKTYELVLRFWEQRNQLFLVLASVVAAAALLTYVQTAALRIAEGALMASLSKDATQTQEEIRANLPLAFDMLIAFLVVAVFYLMANLYHRSAHIINYYTYLRRLEIEIRDELKFEARTIAFTREGTFYERTGLPKSRLLGLSYKVVLGSLLFAFFFLRIVRDQPDWSRLEPDSVARIADWGQQSFLFLLDIFVAVPTAMMFFGYATLSARAAHLREKYPT
jgi:Trk-type K+ transport system membrane component